MKRLTLAIFGLLISTSAAHAGAVDCINAALADKNAPNIMNIDYAVALCAGAMNDIPVICLDEVIKGAKLPLSVGARDREFLALKLCSARPIQIN